LSSPKLTRTSPLADALDLRPENGLALHYARMSSGHRDLLTIDDLPMKPEEVSRRIEGIALVDHNVPLSVWAGAKVVGASLLPFSPSRHAPEPFFDPH